MSRKVERIDRSKMGKRRWNRNHFYKKRRQKNVRRWIIFFIIIGIIALVGCGSWYFYTQKIKPKDEKAVKKQEEVKADKSKKKEAAKDEKKDGTKDGTKAKESALDSKVKAMLSGMTLEDKAAQLFFVRPEAVTGIGVAVQAGEATKAGLAQYPVGGIIYLTQNIENEAQIKEMLAATKQYSKYPIFLGVEEEGGSMATQVANSGVVEVPKVSDMSGIGTAGDAGKAYETGTTIGGYLAAYGFNVNFAPFADIYSNQENTPISLRSFGTTPELVAAMVPNVIKGLQEQKISAAVKYFPGSGDSVADGVTGVATSAKNLEQLQQAELVPFKAAVKANVEFIMAGHNRYPAITGDESPASLSPKIITDVLRTEMGYEGIVITNAMDAPAVASYYEPGDAAVRAIQAGVDMILMPANFEAAYTGIVAAAQSGVITEERLNESVTRILRVKLKG